MCIICNELDKLTTLEAVRNLGEITEEIGSYHAQEVLIAIGTRETDRLADPNVVYTADDNLASLEALKLSIKLTDSLVGEQSEEGQAVMNELIDECEKAIQEENV